VKEPTTSPDGPEHRACLARLSSYLDDQLPPDERRPVQEHLSACASCRAVADELEGVRRQARALGPIEPPRDLWPDIQGRLGDAEVVPLPLPSHEGDGAVRSPWRRRVWFTVPQLAAAGVVLALAAGAVAWNLKPAAVLPGTAAAEGLSGALSEVRPAAGGSMDRGAAESVQALEALLHDARDRLDANTVRILEKNLAVIERAIAEARAALEVDPENRFLEDHLRATERRRTDYLEQTRALLEWSA
jgi:anti-sigma factor RsiW